MKNRFILAVIILLTIGACRKDEPIKDDSLEQGGLFSLSTAKRHLDSLLRTNSIHLDAHWEEATLASDDKFSFAEVPYSTDKKSYNLYRLNNEDVKDDVQRVKYSRSTLLIYTSGDGVVKTNIVTYIPDTSYIDDKQRNLEDNKISSIDSRFSGYIEYKDISGIPMRLLKVNKGKVQQELSLSSGSSALRSSKMANGASAGKKMEVNTNNATIASCTPICTPIFLEVCAGPACPGPMPEDCQCNIQQIGENCYMICSGGGGDVPTPPPGGGGGTGGGGTGSDINNKTTDPCLKATVDQLLKVKNIEGTMAEIISTLEANTEVDIKITQGITARNVPAEYVQGSLHRFQDPDFNPISQKFEAEIKIDERLFGSMSKEGVAATLIHEVLHGYMNYQKISYNNEFAQHTIISEKYIQALTGFLVSKYAIPVVDATALAWHGIEGTKLFQDTQTFKIGDQEVSQRDLQGISANYLGGLDDKPNSGKPLCDD